MSPGSTVTYTVTAIDATGNSNPPATVTTSTPSVPTSFTFAAAGDHGASPPTTASLLALDASPASFYLALGDLDYDETPTDAAWCDYVHASLPTKGAAFPFEVVSGNHEEDPGPNGGIRETTRHGYWTGSARLRGPAAPTGPSTRSDYPAGAPLARVIMISPQPPVSSADAPEYVPGNPHYDWLAATIDAARRPDNPWVIVGMHFPCLTAGQYQCATGSQLMNLLVDRRVDSWF